MTKNPKSPRTAARSNPRASAAVGDWIEARGLPGHPSRHGQILEILGPPGHERYRVRWDEVHESILFPADGVSILPHHGPGAA